MEFGIVATEVVGRTSASETDCAKELNHTPEETLLCAALYQT